jgi:hypothetical protein
MYSLRRFPLTVKQSPTRLGCKHELGAPPPGMEMPVCGFNHLSLQPDLREVTSINFLNQTVCGHLPEVLAAKIVKIELSQSLQRSNQKGVP